MLNLYSCVSDMVLKLSKASEFKPAPLGETDAFFAPYYPNLKELCLCALVFHQKLQQC